MLSTQTLREGLLKQKCVVTLTSWSTAGEPRCSCMHAAHNAGEILQRVSASTFRGRQQLQINHREVERIAYGCHTIHIGHDSGRNI